MAQPVANSRPDGDNLGMATGDHAMRPQESCSEAPRAFRPGTVVVVSLNNPREKFWGAILELASAGLSIRGIDLSSFDDFVSMFREGEAVTGSEVFFPMHRVARIEADLRNAGIPSISEQFHAATGKSAAVLFHPGVSEASALENPRPDQPRSVPDR